MPALAGLPRHLVSFVAALREHGIPVGPSETVDAGRVLMELDLLDRETLREGLACALLRRASHRATFDGVFELWFPAGAGGHGPADLPQLPRGPGGKVDVEAAQTLLSELLAANPVVAQATAGQLVEELGAYQSQEGPAYSAYQTLRDVAPETLIGQIAAGMRQLPGEMGAEVAAREAARRVAGLRTAVEAETRRRAAERVGRERVARYGVPRQAAGADLLRASAAELESLRRDTQALARLMAARLALRRRRSHRGEIDLRKTMRASMSTGGVPIRLITRKPHPVRPELVVLCDLSGSVAGFSHFTMLLVSALREQFSRLRIFAFVDAVDEVTRFFAPEAERAGVVERMFGEASLIGAGGHSDYGAVLRDFSGRWPGVVTARTSLLILGDARSNYREPNVAALRELADTAKRAHWLNPEQRSRWTVGDSAAHRYADVIDMHECRSAAQLTEVIARLLPV